MMMPNDDDAPGPTMGQQLAWTFLSALAGALAAECGRVLVTKVSDRVFPTPPAKDGETAK